MILNRKFLLVLLLCLPLATFADDASETQYDINNVIETQINNAENIDSANTGLKTAFDEISSADKYKDVSEDVKKEQEKIINEKIKEAKSCRQGNSSTATGQQALSAEEKSRRAQKIKDAEDKYKAAKEKEQSTANKTLTAATTAAMGIGGMELAMGLSEQKADKDAEADMKSYISTFRCKYADGKLFKGGPDPIELPGGNDEKLLSLKNEYIALAKDLKERKEALGLKPGIESEEILDKAEMGLYDDENVGITSGVYGSLYRAQALNSEEDQAKIDADKSEASKRVKGGAIAVGAGAVVGIAGNALINNDSLKTKIKEFTEKRDEKKEQTSLDKLKQCLKSGEATDVDSLEFKKFKPSSVNLKNIKCDGQEWKTAINKRSATYLFEDIDDAEIICFKLTYRFGKDIAKKLWGSACGCTQDTWDDKDNRCAGGAPSDLELVEKFKNMGIDLKEDSWTGASFQINGDCWYGLTAVPDSPNKETQIDLDADGTCKGLTTKGTWWVDFWNHTMYGQAKCEYRPEITVSVTSKYRCFCKIDRITKSEDILTAKKTPWVNDGLLYEQDECDKLCAERCSSYTAHLQDFREGLLVDF